MEKHKKSYKSLLAMMVLPLLLMMCTKSSEVGPSLVTQVTVKGTTIEAHQAYTRFLFSTDGGTTWTAVPFLKVGQKFMVAVQDDKTESVLSDQAFTFDWSTSSPKASNDTSPNPEFTFQDNNKLYVVINDKFCAVDPTVYVGNYHGAEGAVVVNGGADPGFNGSTDAMTVNVDPANTSSGLIFTNLFGDGPTVTFTAILTSTTPYDQVLTIPEQSTSEGGTVSGSGSFDQCNGILGSKLVISYDVGGDLYEWTYTLTKD